MLVLSKCSFLWLIYCCQEDSQCCFPMLNKVRIQIKTWGKNNPLDYMGACRTWYCVCGCTWSASVHTISSHAIINLIFLKVCARHIHVEYTQIHTYIVCIVYSYAPGLYTHIHKHTENTSLTPVRWHLWTLFILRFTTCKLHSHALLQHYWEEHKLISKIKFCP